MSERIVKVLPVSLTDAEVNERSARCTRLVREASERSVHLEATKKRAKAMIEEAALLLDGKRCEHDQLARIVGERKEDREVECEERLVRADRRRVVTRLDTMEEIESHPVSDDEMRKGAKWAVNYDAGRAEMRHPEEPEVLLNTRPLTDAEKQVPLPGADGEVKATTLAEAAAIAAARESGDLPEVSSRTLDSLTGFRTQATSPRDAVFSAGIEQTNGAAGPKLPTATVLVLAPAKVKLSKSPPLEGFDWLPGAQGGLESAPLDAETFAEVCRELEQHNLLDAVSSRTVTGRWSDELSEVSAVRATYDAFNEGEKDRLADIWCDGAQVQSSWREHEQGERIEMTDALTRAQVVAVKLRCSEMKLPIAIAPAAEFPCAEPGCGAWLLLHQAHAAGLCAKHADKRAAALSPGASSEPNEKLAAKSKKKAKGAPDFEAIAEKLIDACDATMNERAWGLSWRDVLAAELPPALFAKVAGAYRDKAKRMGLTEADVIRLGKMGEGPGLGTADAPAQQPSP